MSSPRVALVTDSTCYMTTAQQQELGVVVVPLHVSLGDWSFDEPDVDPREFYRRLREESSRPTTSQPSPGEFLSAFERATAAGAREVLCVTCSAGISGTHQSARLAARMAELPVEVIDSGTISGGLLLIVGEVARATRRGATFDDAVLQAKSMSGRVWSTWSADTTALLEAGGRLSDDVPEGVAILGLEGSMRVLGSARSVAESVALQAETILASAAASPTRVTVGHGDVPELADALERALVGQPGIVGVDRYVVGPVVGAHAGPGNFGASYLIAP